VRSSSPASARALTLRIETVTRWLHISCALGGSSCSRDEGARMAFRDIRNDKPASCAMLKPLKHAQRRHRPRQESALPPLRRARHTEHSLHTSTSADSAALRKQLRKRQVACVAGTHAPWRHAVVSVMILRCSNAVRRQAGVGALGWALARKHCSSECSSARASEHRVRLI
jgi:hypothetical protein